MILDDKAQHPWPAAQKQGFWKALFARPKLARTRRAPRRVGPCGESSPVDSLRRDTGTPSANSPLDLVPVILQGTSLPDGVVELVIADSSSPQRCTLDIQGGRVSEVTSGSALPWTSISGSERAWELALGPTADVSLLSHTGEPALAERVIAALGAALGKRPEKEDEWPSDYSVLDCS